jgi:hypothetical protein
MSPRPALSSATPETKTLGDALDALAGATGPARQLLDPLTLLDVRRGVAKIAHEDRLAARGRLLADGTIDAELAEHLRHRPPPGFVLLVARLQSHVTVAVCSTPAWAPPAEETSEPDGHARRRRAAPPSPTTS